MALIKTEKPQEMSQDWVFCLVNSEEPCNPLKVIQCIVYTSLHHILVKLCICITVLKAIFSNTKKTAKSSFKFPSFQSISPLNHLHSQRH